MIYSENTDRLQRCCFGIIGLLLVVGYGLVIFAHVYWWVDWMSFAIAIAAFFAYAVIAAIVSYASVHDILIKRRGWCEGNIAKLVWMEAFLVASLSAPLWYYYLNTPGCIGFWSCILPSVAIGCPLCMNLIVVPFAILVGRTDEKNFAREVDETKEKWKPFLIGSGEENFRKQVEEFRQEFNLHFAERCCMRMVAPLAITWWIADAYVKKCVSVNPRQMQAPRHSLAHIETMLCVCGEYIKIRFNLFPSGAAAFRWGEDGSDEEFPSWQEMVRAIDGRLKS